jgi:hypothetical protein
LEEFEGFFGGHGRDRTRIYAPARIRNRFARGKAKGCTALDASFLYYSRLYVKEIFNNS